MLGRRPQFAFRDSLFPRPVVVLCHPEGPSFVILSERSESKDPYTAHILVYE